MRSEADSQEHCNSAPVNTVLLKRWKLVFCLRPPWWLFLAAPGGGGAGAGGEEVRDDEAILADVLALLQEETGNNHVIATSPQRWDKAFLENIDYISARPFA